ncbi:MAG: VOC family protein [Acidimicrobiales bacterium]
MPCPSIDAIVVADRPEAWNDAGFTVDADGSCRIGSVRIELVGREHGKRILSWRLRDIPPVESIDGLATTASDREPGAPAAHTNGAVAIDHVVIMSPDVDRTSAALADVGVSQRRTRHVEAAQYGFEARQVFFKLADVVLELIGPDTPTDDGPARFFGLAHTVADIDATASALGALLPNVKDAVQPGRRIATLRHKDVDVSVATAFMSPDPA